MTGLTASALLATTLLVTLMGIYLLSPDAGQRRRARRLLRRLFRI
ncbi:hypothetical protein AB0J72_54745 [Dactylosporangium sp. NPDC049742]